MNKKYLPFIALLAAAFLFYWVKKHQKGNRSPGVTTEKVTTAYTELKGGNKTIIYSKHAQCRMDCRHIDESEVKQILQEGTINFNKIEEDDRGVTYPLEGDTKDGQHVRIVFAPHENEVTVVTVIDLNKEWPCNCN